jgi:DNA-binding helix-hairpin-helix protein with protein kinase domain
MQVQRLSNGQPLTLDPAWALGAGGEARIYCLPEERGLVAKVYHTPTVAQARKLAAMVANPPADPMAAKRHISIAWPVDLLCTADRQRRVIGFLLPHVTGMRPLIAYYNPLTRRQCCPFFNYRYLHRTAHNLAATVRALHARGYVIGDVNESNVLVTDTALVTLVDTDSFQVPDPRHGTVYRCAVGKPEYTPPELQGRPFAQIERAPEHDLFGLAVLIFQLLMEGTHPFAGVYQGSGDPPPYERRIAAGHFPCCTQQPGPYRPMPLAPPMHILHPALQALFVRCFAEGHRRPRGRPDAQTWQHALLAAEDALIACSVNDQHLYNGHQPACPWCARTVRLGGRDPFPSRQMIRAKSRQYSAPALQQPTAATGTPPTARPPSPGHPSRPPQPVQSAAAQTAATYPALWLRLWSTLTGGLLGALCGALMGVLVHVLLTSQLAPDAFSRLYWGGIWGSVWGTMWGLCRLPVASLTSTPSSGARRVLTGALLGACIGALTAAVVGVAPGGILEAHHGTLLEVLSRLPQQDLLDTSQRLLQEVTSRFRVHATPGLLSGTLLGLLWGARGR